MRILPFHLFFLLVFCSGVVLAVSSGDAAWQGAAGVCLLSIAFAVAVVRPRLRVALRDDIPDFLTVFLAFQFLNKTMTIVSLAAGDLYMTSYEAADLVGPLYTYRAECVHLVAMVLFTAGWLLVESSVRRRLRAPRRAYSTNVLIRFYLVVTSISLGLRSLSGAPSLGLLSGFLEYSSLAAVGVLLSTNADWGIGGKRVWLSILMLGPAFYFALASGTKSALIVAALPLLMSGLAKGLARVAIILAPFVVFMVAFGIPLSQEMRAANWESVGGHEEISVLAGSSRVSDRYMAGEAIDLIASTFIKFCDRASSAEIGGVVMRIAEEDGLIGVEPIRLLPAIFVPRMFWPDKPVIMPGAWFTWYLGRAASPETATSSTATMLGTEMYWMFGALGLSLMFMLGLLYSAVWNRLQALSELGLMGFAGMYALLGSAIRFEESSTIYAISGPIAYLLYAYVFVFAERWLVGGRL